MNLEADKIFREIARQPVYKSAQILDVNDDVIRIHTTWDQRYNGREDITTFTRDITVTLSDGEWKTSLPAEILYQKLCSRLGEYTAVISSVPSSNDKRPKDYLEVWTPRKKLVSWDLSAYVEFGDVFTDDCFGCLEWDDSKSHVFFIAEKQSNVPKEKDVSKSNDEDEKASLYLHDWGEELLKKHHSVLCQFNIHDGSVLVLEFPDMSCGHAVYSSHLKSIVGVAWKHEPRRLGLLHCKNRESVLYVWSCVNKSHKVVTDSGLCVFGPGISQDGMKVFYMENSVGGPHLKTSKLMVLNLESLDIKELISVPERPVPTANDEVFAGVYCDKLPRNCLMPGNLLVFNSVTHSRLTPFLCDIDREAIYAVGPVNIAVETEAVESLQIVDTYRNYLLAITTNVLKPPVLSVGKLCKSDTKVGVEWITQEPQEDSKPVGLIFDVKFDGLNDNDFPYFGLYVETKLAQRGLIVCPHGGPHAISANVFDPIYCSFAALGYSLLFVNYKGSLGNGEDCVNALCGNIGALDVQNVYHAIQIITSKFNIDPSKLLLFGGSHGGFIVTHLIGQYPDAFRACVARNPVTDVSSMLAGTDIPDWCYSVLDKKYNPEIPPDPSVLIDAWNASPIRYVTQVKTPTLLLIGDKDLRVPPYQGYSYYLYLRSNGVSCRLHHYEDTHGLRKPTTLKNTFIQTCAWFDEHLDAV